MIAELACDHTQTIGEFSLFDSIGTGAADPQGRQVVRLVENSTKTMPSMALRQKSEAEQLFEATAQAKIWASRVAMHLRDEDRARFFCQIDRLHDADEWQEGDKPLKLYSFKSFVRSVLYFDMNQKPSLALLPNGRLMALWREGESRLTVDFMADDMVRWAIFTSKEGNEERASGITHLTRLREILAPYDGGRWFNGS